MTITLTRDEAQQVLDALQCATPPTFSAKIVEDWQSAVEFLRARLSAPEPEPVAWIKKDRSSIEVSIMSKEYMRNEGFEPLYTAPPQREWQGLTDEEYAEIMDKTYGHKMIDAVVEKLREKNT